MKAFSYKRIALFTFPPAIAILALASNQPQMTPATGATSSALSTTVESTPVSAQGQSSESELPTKEDLQLAQQYNSLVTELDKPPSLGREMVNYTRSAELSGNLQALQSQSPVSTQTLARARRHVRGLLPQLQELKKLTPPAPSYIMERRGKLVMDGKIDELAWQRSIAIPIQFQELARANPPKARARLLWDAQFLYVGFEVFDTKIIAPAIERDGEVWKYDCIELFLMPSQRFGTYWEIEISPTGSILDYLCYKHPNQWGSDFHTKETMQGLQIGRTIRGTANQEGDRDEGYTIEVAIPFDQFPGLQKGAAKGDQIYALLGWVNNDSNAAGNSTTSLAQVPYVGWFHSIWSYQPFNLVTKNP